MVTNDVAFVRDQLDAKIENASSAADFIGILTHIPLSSLKTFAKQQIAQISTDEVNKIYYETCPFTDILSSDVQQHILSFDGFYHSKRVCKQWKLLSERNENIKMKKLYQSTIIPFASSSETFIVDPKRRHPNAVEIGLGYEGPMGLEDALIQSKAGDRLLIHDGQYERPHDAAMEGSLDLIGIGDDVSFKITFYLWNEKATISFDNIKFQSNRSVGIGCVREVTFKNCHFVDLKTYASAIQITSNANVNILSCSFMGMNSAVYVYEGVAKLNIKQSLFKNCGSLPRENAGYCSHAITIFSDAAGSTLECIGNTFEDCLTHPITQENVAVPRHCFRAMEPSHLYVLQGNIIKGNNELNGQTFDANTIYA